MVKQIIERKDKCSVSNCIGDKQSGDKLFCFGCRTRWIEYCKYLGIHEKIVPDEVVNIHLKKFLEM